MGLPLGQAERQTAQTDSRLETNIVTPLYGTFFKLLGCVAAPMIFLSVLWGILGVGDISALGRIGRKMLLGFIRDTFAVTAFCVVFFPFLGPGLAGSSSQGTNMSNLMKLILGIFPSNIVEPFATGNMLQVVFLSFTIGIGLLYLGAQADSIKTAIGQPSIATFYILLVFYSAGACRIACTPAWIIMSVLVCAVLAIATPPVVGGGVIAISIIFAHMNIPEEALAVALTIDMLSDFPVTAFCIFSLQMSLINLASRLGMLDKDKLRS